MNRPKNEVHSYNFDGQMNYHHTGTRRQYVPNSFGDSWSDETGPTDTSWESDGELVRVAQTLRADDDDFGQARILLREVFSDDERAEFVKTVAGALAGVGEPVLGKALEYWRNVDEQIAGRIEDQLKADAGENTPGA